MCAQCLTTQVDITSEIEVETTLLQCKSCLRYQRRPDWVDCPWESTELMALCLKRITGLKKNVKLIDATFIWTEPHSKRVKVKLTVMKEVLYMYMMMIIILMYVILLCIGFTRNDASTTMCC